MLAEPKLGRTAATRAPRLVGKVSYLLDVDDEQGDQLWRAIRNGRKDRMPGAVRASIGLATTRNDIDCLVTALTEAAIRAPRWSYSLDLPSGDYIPEPNPRPMPRLRLGFFAAAAGGSRHMSSGENLGAD